jgi:sulfatase modifying factor 1
MKKPPDKDMVWIPGGTFMMGSDDHYPEEAPAHAVTVNGFWIDQWTVTNAQFSRFVEETNYVTSAERAPRLEDYSGALSEMLVPAPILIELTSDSRAGFELRNERARPCFSSPSC